MTRKKVKKSVPDVSVDDDDDAASLMEVYYHNHSMICYTVLRTSI